MHEQYNQPVCYRELDWPMEQLTLELNNYFKDIPWNKSPWRASGFWTIDHRDLLSKSSELVKFFDHWGFTVKSAHVYSIDPSTFKGPIHKDYVPPGTDYYCARINFPLWNCQHSETLWYSVDPATYTAGAGTMSPAWFWRCSDPNPREIARVVLSKPTVMRIDQAHQVRLTRDGVLRSSLTVEVSPDPVALL
jgi:hypothetical protein